MQQDFADLPVGFGMALAQNVRAMEAFSALSETGRTEILAQARQAASRQEMQALADRLGRP